MTAPREYKRDPKGTSTGGQFTVQTKSAQSAPTRRKPRSTSEAVAKPSSARFKTLAPGEDNDAATVKEMQQLLTALGMGNLKVDGDYGANTTAAVKAAQRRLGLKPTGKASKALVNKLLNAYDLSPCIKRSEDLDPDEIERRYNPDQPRIPSGEHGGRWTHVGAVAKALATRVVGHDVTPEVRQRASTIRRDGTPYESMRRWEQGDLSDTELGAIGRLNGFDAPPTVGTKADLDEAVSGGWTELWRGVGSRGRTSAAEMAERFRTGDYEPGFGIYGNGFYTTTDQAKALHFTHHDGDTLNDQDPDGVLRMALHPDARVLEAQAGTVRATLELLGVDYDNERDAYVVLNDLGHVAAARGWDAVLVRNQPDGAPGGVRDQYIILNRSAVMVQEADQ